MSEVHSMSINQSAYPDFDTFRYFGYTDTIYNLYQNNNLVWRQPADTSNIYATVGDGSVLTRMVTTQLEDDRKTIQTETGFSNANLRFACYPVIRTFPESCYRMMEDNLPAVLNSTDVTPYIGLFHYLNVNPIKNWVYYVTIDYVINGTHRNNIGLNTFINDNTISNEMKTTGWVDYDNMITGYNFVPYFLPQNLSPPRTLVNNFSVVPVLEQYTQNGIIYHAMGNKAGVSFTTSYNYKSTALSSAGTGTMLKIAQSSDTDNYMFLSLLNPDGSYNTFQNDFNGSVAGLTVNDSRKLNDKATAKFISVLSTTQTIALNRIYSVNDILNIVSSFGVFFTGDVSTAQNGQLDDDLMYLGKMYDDGHTDGTYTHGAENRNQLQWNFTDATDSPGAEHPVDVTKPTPPPKPTDDETTTDKHSGSTTKPEINLTTVSGNAFTSYYQMGLSTVNRLGELLSAQPESFWKALGTATDSSMYNILQYIVSLKWYPFSITSQQPNSGDTSVTDLQFGFSSQSKIDDVVTSPTVLTKLGSTTRIMDFGLIDVPYRTDFESFLDYEPYTTVKIYLPYIGQFTLPANQVVGYQLGLWYVTDIVTGMCTAVVFNQYDTVLVKSGKIGADITVSGNDIITQSEQIAGSFLKLGTDIVGGTVNISANAISENIGGTLQGIVNTTANITADAISIASAKRAIPETIGTGSGFGNIQLYPRPTVTILRPAVSIPYYYGHTVGYVDNSTKRLSSVSGFTVCSNPDLSGISATEDELTEIRSYLTSGVYL